MNDKPENTSDNKPPKKENILKDAWAVLKITGAEFRQACLNISTWEGIKKVFKEEDDRIAESAEQNMKPQIERAIKIEEEEQRKKDKKEELANLNPVQKNFRKCIAEEREKEASQSKDETPPLP